MIIEHDGRGPLIDKTVFVADNAVIIGDVKIGRDSSIWFGVVVRGDIESITIGEMTNIQDLCVLHVPDDESLEIGNNVTVGHKTIVHGCKIGSNCLIGMGSVLMNGVEVGDGCIIGAGSLVTEGTMIPPGSLAFGSPAKVRRELTPEEIKMITESSEKYFGYSRRYLK